MKRIIFVFMTALFLSGPVLAADTQVNAEAKAGTEVESEGGFFSRAWTGIKGFFGADDDQAQQEQKTPAAAESETEAQAEAGAGDDSLIDKAADKTKTGVEWTKETAGNVADDAVGGAKAVGGAVKGVFSSDTEAEVEAEAEAEASGQEE